MTILCQKKKEEGIKKANIIRFLLGALDASLKELIKL